MLFMKQDWSTLKKIMMLKSSNGGGLTEHTVDGNPAVFDTNVEKPLTQLLIPFTPIQSGTGDPSPYNERSITGWTGVTAYHAGKNLFEDIVFDENGSIGADGAVSSSNFFTYNSEPFFVDAGTYNLTGVNKRTTASNLRIHEYSSSNTWIKQIDYQSKGENEKYNITFNVQQGGAYIKISRPVNFENGSLYCVSTYPVTFPAMGKNLLDPSTLEQGSITEGGGEGANSKRVRSGYMPVEAGKKYTVSATGFTGFMHFFTADKENIGPNMGATNIIAPEGSAFARCFFRNAGNTDITPSDIVDPMFEQGSSATAYEPYTNTIYGCSLDVVTGELTVDTVCDIFTWGNYIGTTDLTNVARRTFELSKQPIDTSTSSGKYCDKVKFLYDYTRDIEHFYTSAGNSRVYIFLPIGTSDSTTVQVVYPLAEPITYQLTPQQINTLIGDNTIWSDTNGENTIKYLKKG